MMKKTLLALLALIVLVQPLSVTAKTVEETDSEKDAVIYNLISGDEIAIVPVVVRKNKKEIVINFDSKKMNTISASYWGEVEREKVQLDIYNLVNSNETIKIVVTDQVISGSITYQDESLKELVSETANSYGFIIIQEGSSKEVYDQIIKDEMIQANFTENKAKVTQLFSSADMSSSDGMIFTMSSTLSKYVRANAGAVIAEGTAYYDYIGSNQYYISSCRYITTNGFLDPLDESDIKIYADINGSAIWWNSVDNQTTTETVGKVVSSTGTAAIVAYASKLGFKVVNGIPIPFLWQDYDTKQF